MCGVGEEVYELRTLLCILQKGHVYKESFRDGKALSGSFIPFDSLLHSEYNFVLIIFDVTEVKQMPL